MNTTVRYPNQTKQISSNPPQLTSKNKFDFTIVGPNGGYPIFSEQVCSISSLDMLSGMEFLAEFEIDPRGEIIKTLQEIRLLGDNLIIHIRSLDGSQNEQFSITLEDAMVIGASMGSLKDRNNDRNTTLLTSSFDLSTSDTIKINVVFHYNDADWSFPNIK
jgi:hypothetical protein